MFVALAVFARLLRVLMIRQRELVLADETLTAEATPILDGTRDIAACGARKQAYATVRATVDNQAAATRALAGLDLRTKRLNFAYSPKATPVVHHLDLVIPEDEHLAVVGPSGIGKSTLSMLLTGLRQPTEGEVLLGGLPLWEIAEPELRTMMALVPQEAYVFTGTVRENLAYLCPAGIRDGRLLEAADRVGAWALVHRLGGLDAMIDEPSALSAGEKQLIALARAYASPARLILLDEATCHLDPAAEAKAETAFAIRPGTLIVIAHRISSATRAQRILLMDGTTALTGTHSELLIRSPLYADLVSHWTADQAPGLSGTHSEATRKFS
ncbi:ATP-binding cassette domain-containing protein [Streptosporangium sp. NPDC002607]